MVGRPFRGGRRTDQLTPYEGRHAHPAPAEPAHAPTPEAGQPPAAKGRWAPVVVGEPIFEFEPRPPGPQICLPDTIVDGWSSKHFTMRLASIRGYAHRYSGASRQDDAVAAFHPPSGAVVIAVADGVSSAPLSHIGAATACHAAVDMTLRELAAGRGRVDWALVLQAVASELEACGKDLLQDPSAAAEEIEKLLATTLVVGCVVPAAHGPVAALVHIGDSGGWVLRQGHYHPVLGNKNHPHQQVISSAVTPLPRIPARLTPAECPLPPGSVLLIGTDGFGDPLGDGTGQVGQLFASQLRTPPPARAFAHLLDFSRETFDDDRTLVALWPHPPQAQPGK